MNTDWFHLSGAGAWIPRYGAAEPPHVYDRTLAHLMPNTETTRIWGYCSWFFSSSRDGMHIAMGACPSLILCQNQNPGALNWSRDIYRNLTAVSLLSAPVILLSSGDKKEGEKLSASLLLISALDGLKWVPHPGCAPCKEEAKQGGSSFLFIFFPFLSQGHKKIKVAAGPSCKHGAGRHRHRERVQKDNNRQDI